MKIHSARRSLAGWFLAVAAGLLAAGCGGGGGGTSSGQFQGGLPIISPDGATFYAGVPSSISVTGGRRPYTITFSEPSLVGVPNPVVLDGGSTGALTFNFVPANPAVIDTGLPPGALPVRTVNVALRDAGGQTAAASFKVGQNFLLGYGISLTSNCPIPGSATVGPPACAGGETVVRLVSVTNGNLYGDRPVRFEVVRGPFGFVQLPEGTVVGNSYTTITDHAGIATAIFRVDRGVSGQFAVLRVIDVATGAFINEVFPVTAASQTALTALPDSFTFTGANNTVCGTGTGQFEVMDGLPPYTAISSSPSITVTPTSTGDNPAIFTITANNSSACVDATIVVTDASGGRVTVKVSTVKGATAIPTPPAISVSPTSITLACGTSGSVSVVGGSGGYILNSTHPRVTAVASGNTITITRLAGDPATSFPTTGTVSVTDGATTAKVDLAVPANCP